MIYYIYLSMYKSCVILFVAILLQRFNRFSPNFIVTLSMTDNRTTFFFSVFGSFFFQFLIYSKNEIHAGLNFHLPTTNLYFVLVI